MNLLFTKDELTYELSVTSNFEICVTGRLPQEMKVESNALEQLLAHLETNGFFDQITSILGHLEQQTVIGGDQHETETAYEDLDNSDIPF